MRRPVALAATACGPRATSSGSASHGMCGFGSSKCRCGGISPCWSASTTLISPAMPAADSRWPMLVLTEPISRRCGGSRPGRGRRRAPGPRSGRRGACRCRGPRRSRRRPASTPASASAARITASCDGPFGAVRPLLRPSWLTADPADHGEHRSPSARASDRRLSTTTPQPSPRTKPSAGRRTSCTGRRAPASAPRDSVIVARARGSG